MKTFFFRLSDFDKAIEKADLRFVKLYEETETIYNDYANNEDTDFEYVEDVNGFPWFDSEEEATKAFRERWNHECLSIAIDKG